MGFATPDPLLRREWIIRRGHGLPRLWTVWRHGLWHATCGRWETAMHIATGDRHYRPEVAASARQHLGRM